MKLKELSLEEKIKLLVGAKDTYMNTESLDGKIHSIQMSDGPIGPHYPEPLLWLPSITSLSNTWDEEMVAQYVDALADICVLNNVDMLLGPAINIKRTPVCGRNFEYFSEDSYLTGVLAAKYVETLQNRGIAATVKHFCANNREYARLYCSSNIDERALREIYTRAFEIIINKSKPWAIMCSYNALNGTYVAESSHALNEVLRTSLNYQGLVVSDWGAVHDMAKSLKAGLDLAMPYQGGGHYEEIKEGLKSGLITEKEIDVAVTRLEVLINQILSHKEGRYVKYSDKERHDIALKVVEESIVLLKNEDNILPLKGDKELTIVGEHSEFPELGGGGSCNHGDDPNSPFDKQYEIIQRPVFDLLKEQLPNTVITYIAGYHSYPGFGYQYSTMHSSMLPKRAKDADIAVVFIGTNRIIECEGYDRETLKLPTIQEDVIHEVCKYNDNVIVVIEAGGVIDVSSFKDKVKAILYTGFGGERINEAITNVLLGKTSPSGKLTETFVSSVNDNPLVSPIGLLHDEDYKDSIFVGYRLYETKGMKVNYPFGYGLSYASFTYSDLAIKQNGKYDFEISFKISNDSDIPAKEIAEVYVSDLKPIRPKAIKELVGFKKVSLKPHETKTISLSLNKESFQYFDEKINDWNVDSGEYEIQVSASVKDVRLSKKVIIKD